MWTQVYVYVDLVNTIWSKAEWTLEIASSRWLKKDEPSDSQYPSGE